MGTAIRPQASTVEQATQQTHRYHFMQLLRWLEYADELKHYTLSAHHSLGFPASDILCSDKARKQIVLRFMGLFGVDAPLPAYFLCEASQSSENGEVLRAFLNLFNHRLYQFFYCAWKKTQPSILLEQGNNTYLHYLMALSGGSLSINDKREFSAAGLLGQHVRSASGLQSLLEKYLALNVSIQQFVPRWVTTELHCSLDKNFLLGESMLGQRVLDLSSEILITLGTLSLSQALMLLPNQTEGLRLHNLIQRYLEPYIQYKLCLKVEPERITALTLGKSTCYLGFQSWIGDLTQNGPISIYC